MPSEEAWNKLDQMRRNDSGMTLHTLEGDDGITRHFLDRPGT